MTVSTSPARQVKQSLEILIDEGLSDNGWTRVEVLDEFPDDQRSRPCVAVEELTTERYPLELGTSYEGNAYHFDLHLFCENGGQRADLVYSLVGDDDTLGVLSHDLPVYEIVAASTGAQLFVARMDIEESMPNITTGDTPMDKYRGVITVLVQKR